MLNGLPRFLQCSRKPVQPSLLLSSLDSRIQTAASTALPVPYGKGFEPPLTTGQSLLGAVRFSLWPRTRHMQRVAFWLSKSYLAVGQLQRRSAQLQYQGLGSAPPLQFLRCRLPSDGTSGQLTNQHGCSSGGSHLSGKQGIGYKSHGSQVSGWAYNSSFTG